MIILNFEELTNSKKKNRIQKRFHLMLFEATPNTRDIESLVNFCNHIPVYKLLESLSRILHFCGNLDKYLVKILITADMPATRLL